MFVDVVVITLTIVGRLFNKYGEISKPWWSSFTLTGFQNRSQCLVDQYNKYPLDVYGRRIFVCITILQLNLILQLVAYHISGKMELAARGCESHS